jgi:hypothetical protein
MHNLPEGFVERVRKLRASHGLHAEVIEALQRVGTATFPTWVFVGEVGQTPGGRNDGVLFESDGQSTCFEVFATSGQVDRDLLLLRDSSAQKKIAVLLDREIDPKVASAYYRKRPAAPYPALWVSDLLLPDRVGAAQIKLMQYVLGSRLAEALKVSQELRLTAKDRILKSWARDGIDILVGVDPSIKPTLRQVFTLIVVARLGKVGLPLWLCKPAAKTVNEDFDFIIRQVLLGVPMLLLSTGGGWSVMDLSDFEALLWGGVYQGKADGVILLLNPVYEEMRRMFSGPLPEAGDVGRMMRIMAEARRSMAAMDLLPHKGVKKSSSRRKATAMIHPGDNTERAGVELHLAARTNSSRASPRPLDLSPSEAQEERRQPALRLRLLQRSTTFAYGATHGGTIGEEEARRTSA